MTTESYQETTYNLTRLDYITCDVQKVLDVIGDIGVVNFVDEDYVEYYLPEHTTGRSLIIQGDDSWGIVIGAYVYQGHLILVANFGDGGDIMFSLTHSGGCGDNGYFINLIGIDRVGVVLPL